MMRSALAICASVNLIQRNIVDLEGITSRLNVVVAYAGGIKQ